MRTNIIPPNRYLAAAGRLAALSSIALLSLTAAPAFAQGPGWVDLGILPTGTESAAAGVSPSGQVVGESTVTIEGELHAHAFCWSPRTGMVDLGVLPGATESVARAINNRNQIAGSSGSKKDLPAGVRFTIDAAGNVTERRDLGLLPGGHYAIPRAINDAGFIVGEADEEVDGSDVQRAFFWSEAAGMVDLGTLGGSASSAFGINNAPQPQVVGVTTSAENRQLGFVFAVDGMGNVLDRTTLEAPFHALNPSPTAINDGGLVVGQDHVFVKGQTNPVKRSLTWLRGEVATEDLGTLPGGLEALAQAINNRGQVVGFANTAGGIINRGFFWSPFTGMRDLSMVTGGEFLEIGDAAGINDRGQIAATGHLGDGEQHAFLLTLCATDVTSQVEIRRWGLARDPATGRLVQTVTIRNVGRTDLRGRMVLALDGFSGNVDLLNADGTTVCAAPLGSPFVLVNTGVGDVLAPGRSATVRLVFSNARRPVVRFRPRVLLGGEFP